jgi:hypothetical protein
VATAAVLARRGGLALPALDGPDRLAALVAEYAGAMPA